jgi:hypothetical protein
MRTMPKNLTVGDGMSERDLALWMLDQMQDSDRFLGILRRARASGKRHQLDKPEIRALHLPTLRKLHQCDDEETVEVPVTLAAKIAALVERDLLSGPEELIEKALVVYIERTGSRELPDYKQPTLDLARAEIEGRTTGMFHAGFVAGLASIAREEMARNAERDRERDAGRGRDD